MDRLNHVKIVTPDPDAVDRFLREIVQLPEGWALGEGGPEAATATPSQVVSPARDNEGNFSLEGVHAFRGDSGSGGLITGSTQSRQFQILHGEHAHIWAVAIGTRDLEGAHQRCLAAGIPCTDPGVVPFGPSGDIGYFFAEVGGLVFEVMRVEGHRA